MKLVCISDFHSQQLDDLPEGQVLIIAGDSTMNGTVNEMCWLRSWLMKQAEKFPYIIWVAGNHDRLFKTNYNLAKSLIEESGAIYLEDSEVKIGGLRFYGSPWTSGLEGYKSHWAFAKLRTELLDIWKKIPEGLDVLITHMPPWGILDEVIDKYDNITRFGCYDLRHIIKKRKPKIHIFGHIHWSGGKSVKYYDTECFNVALMSEEYEVVNKPTVIEV